MAEYLPAANSVHVLLDHTTSPWFQVMPLLDPGYLIHMLIVIIDNVQCMKLVQCSPCNLSVFSPAMHVLKLIMIFLISDLHMTVLFVNGWLIDGHVSWQINF